MIHTDYNRLSFVRRHRVQIRLYGIRGAGRTFTSCHNLIDLVKVIPENKWPASVMWELPLFSWLSHIRPMLTEILVEVKMAHEWVSRSRLVLYSDADRVYPIAKVLFCVNRPNSYCKHNKIFDYKVDTMGETADYL